MEEEHFQPKILLKSGLMSFLSLAINDCSLRPLLMLKVYLVYVSANKVSFLTEVLKILLSPSFQTCLIHMFQPLTSTPFSDLSLWHGIITCTRNPGANIRHWSSNCDHVGRAPTLVALCCFVCAGWVILESRVTCHQWLDMWCMEALHQTVRQSFLPSHWLQCWIKNNWRVHGALLQLSNGSKEGKYHTRPRDADFMPKVWGPRP